MLPRICPTSYSYDIEKLIQHPPDGRGYCLMKCTVSSTKDPSRTIIDPLLPHQVPPPLAPFIACIKLSYAHFYIYLGQSNQVLVPSRGGYRGLRGMLECMITSDIFLGIYQT
jgi:hypothetical protein